MNWRKHLYETPLTLMGLLKSKLTMMVVMTVGMIGGGSCGVVVASNTGRRCGRGWSRSRRSSWRRSTRGRRRCWWSRRSRRWILKTLPTMAVVVVSTGMKFTMNRLKGSRCTEMEGRHSTPETWTMMVIVVVMMLFLFTLLLDSSSIMMIMGMMSVITSSSMWLQLVDISIVVTIEEAFSGHSNTKEEREEKISINVMVTVSYITFFFF